MSKISDILIGIVLIGFFAGTFNVIMVNMNSNNVNATEFQEFNQYERTNTEVNTLKQSLEELTAGGTGIFDVIGLLFQSAYSSAKLLFINSLDMVLTLVTKTFSYLEIDSEIATLGIGAITTIILIIIVIRILLSTIFKRET